MITFSKLKGAVQELTRRSFDEKQLGQLMTVYPDSYELRRVSHNIHSALEWMIMNLKMRIMIKWTMHSLPSMTRCLKSATDLLGLICVFSRCHVLNYDLLRSHNVFRSISLSLINAPPGESEASLRHEEFEQLRIDDGTLPVRRQDHLRCPAFDVVFRSSQPTPQVPSLAHQHRQKASHKVRFTVGSRFWGDLCFILMPCCCLLTHEFD